MHIAIIPDGNRRWAKNKGLEPWEGHEEGAKVIERLVRKSFDLGVSHLSFWGSSLDNLKKRPIQEKKAMLDIYRRYFTKLMSSEDIHRNETHINIIGRWREQFPQSLIEILENGIQKTKNYSKCFLNFFLAYSGDDEMKEAIQSIIKRGLDYKDVSFDLIKQSLMTRDLPPVDLLIRTGGEPHLSAGFLMWDIANSQLYFSEKYFPDFNEDDLSKALEDYQQRQRRMGK